MTDELFLMAFCCINSDYTHLLLKATITAKSHLGKARLGRVSFSPPPPQTLLASTDLRSVAPENQEKSRLLEKIFSDVLEDILELSRNYHRCARNLSRQLSVQTSF